MTTQGMIRRTLFAAGTVGFLIAWGILGLFYFLTGDKWREDLREANEGEE